MAKDKIVEVLVGGMPTGKKTPIVGRTIVEVRPISPEEIDTMGWEDLNLGTAVLVLDNGDVLVPSEHDGNHQEIFMRIESTGRAFYVVSRSK